MAKTSSDGITGASGSEGRFIAVRIPAEGAPGGVSSRVLAEAVGRLPGRGQGGHSQPVFPEDAVHGFVRAGELLDRPPGLS
ncbi:hypothetical protein GCM10012319_05660 [Comamonas sp. KCTC 72670]|nr:hypothetical protein GCM10012319_05660 [Comamonas sp. KCTC 72670]